MIWFGLGYTAIGWAVFLLAVWGDLHLRVAYGMRIEALEGVIVHVRAGVARGHARARSAWEARFVETRGGDGGLERDPGRIPAQRGRRAAPEA